MKSISLPVLVLVTFSACAVAQDDELTLMHAESALSEIGVDVVRALSESADEERFRTWNVSTGNQLGGDWILETPSSDYWASGADLPLAERCDSGSDCDVDFGLRRCQTQADCTTGVCTPLEATVTHPGEQPERLCTSHSDTYVDYFYRLVASADEHVDITSLTPADGRYLAALRNAITFLGNSGREVTIRLAYGTYPSAGVDVTSFRDQLTRDLPPWARVELWVGAYRYDLTSWNHAKIVAVDGRTAIVGGVNMWDRDYLTSDPVFDLSMRLAGPAVADTDAFADQIWVHLCYGWSWFGTTEVVRFPATATWCPPVPELAPASVDGDVAVITVGRLGALGPDPSDTALVALLASAKQSIYLSQQDLGPIRKGWLTLGSWPEPILVELVDAVARGVEVYLILSDPSSRPGGVGSASAGYGNGWTATETARAIADQAHDMADQFAPGTDIDAALCAHLHVAPLRPGTDATWPSGAGFANHAKAIFVDDRAFYVGSQNLYPADLAELGFIVDDEAATAEIVDTYWWPLWSSSSVAAVSGVDAPSCEL